MQFPGKGSPLIDNRFYILKGLRAIAISWLCCLSKIDTGRFSHFKEFVSSTNVKDLYFTKQVSFLVLQSSKDMVE